MIPTPKCSKCGGTMYVNHTVLDDANNELYRRRVCRDCGNAVFTIEYELDDTEQVREVWRSLDGWKNEYKHDQYNEKRKNYQKEYAKKNREKLNAYQMEYRKRKREEKQHVKD